MSVGRDVGNEKIDYVEHAVAALGILSVSPVVADILAGAPKLTDGGCPQPRGSGSVLAEVVDDVASAFLYGKTHLDILGYSITRGILLGRMAVVLEIVESALGNVSRVLELVSERAGVTVPSRESAAEIRSGFQPLRVYVVGQVFHSVRENVVAVHKTTLGVALLLEPAVVEVYVNVSGIGKTEINEQVCRAEHDLLGRIAVYGTV